MLGDYSLIKGPPIAVPKIVPGSAASSIPAVSHAAAYLRVPTGRRAENDLSIPDQRRQIDGYCAARGWTTVEAFVEPGSSATDDRRPAFQAMIDAALAKPPAFDVILVQHGP